MTTMTRIEATMARLDKAGDLDKARRERGWTETRTRVATALYNCGLSAREVACEIGGGISRNAVIGKIHRGELGDPQRKLPRRSTDQARGVRQPRQQQSHDRGSLVRVKARAKEQPIPPNVIDTQISIEQRRSLAQLDNTCCHWPVGDPREAEFFFCGAPKANDEDLPYCASHQFRSRLPGSDRARSNPAAFISAGPNASWRTR
ncbi:GcrA family cell cycle regulator [Bradyrhizobium manausense]